MAGKDIFSALVNHLSKRGAKAPREVLNEELIAALPREYPVGGLYKPDEFAELATRLRP